MIKIENVEVMGWEAAIRGMRNPLNSWERSDSKRCTDIFCGECNETCAPYTNGFIIGPNDHDLMMRLAKGGAVHAKYRRMITVYLDITAPLYWWKEWDTYRVGVTPNPADIEMNSCSTMHKIHDKEFTLEDFSHEHLIPGSALDALQRTISELNYWRNMYVVYGSKEYLETTNRAPEDTKRMRKDFWWQMIQLLPSSYNQKRTVMLNYEVLVGMYRDRKNHKLDEWRELCKWIESLPYSEIITGAIKENKQDALNT